jgi:hypothetical protein
MNLFNHIFSYFKCMAKGEIPPTKERLDMALATQKVDSGVTMGVIKTLHKQVVFMII